MSQSPLATAGLGGQGLGVSTAALALGWSCVSQSALGQTVLIATALKKVRKTAKSAQELAWTLKVRSAKTQAIKMEIVPNLEVTGAATQ